MTEKGVGSYQISKRHTSEMRILKALADGEWHRYQQLEAATELSTATLSKHLKQLERGLVEKKLDTSGSEYPYPVYYRIRQQMSELSRNWRDILERALKRDVDFFVGELKQPAYFIEFLNTLLATQLISNLDFYFTVGESELAFEQGLEYFVFSLYREAVQGLKFKLKELADSGENVAVLLARASDTILEFQEATSKVMSKRRSSSVRGKIAETFQRKRKGSQQYR